MTLKSGVYGAAVALLLTGCSSNGAQDLTDGPGEINCSTIVDTDDREFCYEKQRMEYLDGLPKESGKAKEATE
ncbi:MAG: hypothetical protein WD623_00265 [Marinobacter sp.]|uniref:hypothetical protein n=1 Tax=Marinobacter sp. TaxID=50741 RepID=UPI0034A04B27